jgi:hypothetical protein
VAGDFDGDGRIDLACLGATGERIHLLRGSFSIALPLEAPIEILLSTVSTDLNAAHADEDGIIDIIATGPNGLAVAWGSSSNPLAQQVHLDSGAVVGPPAVADLSGDDLIDLAVAQTDGTILLLSGIGGGEFISAGNISGYSAAVGVIAGNLDGDGLRDLLVIPGGSDTPSSLLCDGDLNFSLLVLFDGVATPGARLVDWDGDGLLDSLTPDPDGTGLHLSLGLGDGNFEMPVDLDHAAQIRSLSLGDANGDGALDIALEETGGNWEIQQVEPANSPPPPPLPPGNRVHVDDMAADAGDSSITFPIYIDNLDALAGWTLLLQYDPQVMQFSQINSGPGVPTVPDFHAFDIDNNNGVVSIGTIIDFGLTVSLPSGLNQEVEQAVVDISGNAPSGNYTFGPANGQVPINSNLDPVNSFSSSSGTSIEPELIQGTLTIGGGTSPGSDPNSGGDSNDNETSDNEDPPAEEVTFLRGDVNRDGSVNLTDGSQLQLWLIGSGNSPTCLDAADVNDDGIVNLSDPISLFAFLYQGSNPPPAPFPAVGPDPTADGLDCNL